MKKNFGIEVELNSIPVGDQGAGHLASFVVAAVEAVAVAVSSIQSSKNRKNSYHFAMHFFIVYLFTCCPCPLTPCFSDMILRSRSTNPAFRRRYFDRINV